MSFQHSAAVSTTLGAITSRISKAMSDMNGGAKSEAVSAAFTRWMISLLFAAMLGLAGIVWANVTGQIAELRADTRVSQKESYELRLALQDLKTRLTTLVETLNSREEMQLQRKR